MGDVEDRARDIFVTGLSGFMATELPEPNGGWNVRDTLSPRRCVCEAAWPTENERIGVILTTEIEVVRAAGSHTEERDGVKGEFASENRRHLIRTVRDVTDWLDGEKDAPDLEAAVYAKAAGIIGADKVTELGATAGD